MGFGDWVTHHLAGKRDHQGYIKDSMRGLEKWWQQVAAQSLKLSLVVMGGGMFRRGKRLGRSNNSDLEKYKGVGGAEDGDNAHKEVGYY